MAVFTNQATLSYNNNVRNSNIVTGEIREELSVTKTAVQNSYSADGTVTYAVNIINSGTTDYTGLTVTDNLGEYPVPAGTGTVSPLTYIDGTARYFTNGTLQAAPTVNAGAPLEITGITVPAGGNTTVLYTSRVNGFAPLETTDTITNTATVSGAGLPTDITADAVLPAEAAPNLAITKSVNPVTVVGNGPLTYSFDITNTGNTAAADTDNIAITDTFDPILNITSVNYNGAALEENTDYTYDTATGAFATVPGRLTVPEATYIQDPATGAVSITPGTGTLTITGTIV